MKTSRILAMAAALAWPGAAVAASDIDPVAVEVAAANLAANGLADRVNLSEGPGFEVAGLAGPFDLVLANPPYVELAAELAPSVRAFEPAGALFAGVDGLDDYRLLIPQLPGLLTPEGAALVEIGATQAAAVSAVAHVCGFATSLHLDLGQRARVLRLTLGQ